MKRYKENILTILFGTLLTMVACQKIDADDIADDDAKQKTSTSNKNENNENGSKKDDNDSNIKIPLEEKPDGTLSLPSEKHFILYEYDDNNHHMVYISLHEWNNISSALSEGGNNIAEGIAQRYEEGHVKGWHIPTRVEAKYISAKYSRAYNNGVEKYDDALQTLNNNIETIGGQPLSVWQNKDSKPAFRYLCEDATYSFSLKTGSNITKCGAVTKYNLRLIKDSVITK